MHEYQLRYLPQFYEDLKHHSEYIADHLQNLQAANDLIDATEQAILERLPAAESFEPYHSRKERRYAYYRIYVGNYIVFYVVITENSQRTMEIRRFLYGKSNWKRTL